MLVTWAVAEWKIRGVVVLLEGLLVSVHLHHLDPTNAALSVL